MQYVTLRAGMDDVNFGDAHFKRTDNAKAIYNPLVGNFIMDSFSTEPFMEANVQYNGILGVLGVSNGKLNQTTVTKDGVDNTLSYYAKVGFDKQLNEDLRVRVTGSIYTNSGKSTGGYLYGGDRAGDRYYNVGITTVEADAGVNFVSARANARFNSGFKERTAMQFAGFVKFRGIESFTLIDMDSNSKDAGDGSYTQIAEELVYRLGSKENYFLAARYNTVSGNKTSDAKDQTITRINFGGGWFMTENVVTKIEYVTQSWAGDGFATSKWEGAKFSGIMIEAIIGF